MDRRCLKRKVGGGLPHLIGGSGVVVFKSLGLRHDDRDDHERRTGYFLAAVTNETGCAPNHFFTRCFYNIFGLGQFAFSSFFSGKFLVFGECVHPTLGSAFHACIFLSQSLQVIRIMTGID